MALYAELTKTYSHRQFFLAILPTENVLIHRDQ